MTDRPALTESALGEAPGTPPPSTWQNARKDFFIFTFLIQIISFSYDWRLTELGNESQQGRKYSKIRQMSGSLPNPFTGGSGPLATNINQDKCLGQAVFWICASFISQLRGAPSREDESSRDRGSPHCSGSGERTLNKSFIPSILCTKCDAWQWPLNKQTNKQAMTDAAPCSAPSSSTPLRTSGWSCPCKESCSLTRGSGAPLKKGRTL